MFSFSNLESLRIMLELFRYAEDALPRLHLATATPYSAFPGSPCPKKAQVPKPCSPDTPSLTLAYTSRESDRPKTRCLRKTRQNSSLWILRPQSLCVKTLKPGSASPGAVRRNFAQPDLRAALRRRTVTIHTYIHTHTCVYSYLRICVGL